MAGKLTIIDTAATENKNRETRASVSATSPGKSQAAINRASIRSSVRSISRR
jgi:hypothetical protein